MADLERRRWLTTREAAQLLGITVRDLHRLLDEDQLRGYRYGRTLRLLQDEVEAWPDDPDDPPGTLVPSR